MKKFFAAAFMLTLFSSYIKPEEKPEANECRLFRDAEFNYTCTENQCTATAGSISFSGDEESIQFFKTQEGREVIDKMFHQILVQIISGKSQPLPEADKEALLSLAK